MSQLNVAVVFGIDERRYLQLLREHADKLTINAVGKLRVVAADDLRELLAGLALDPSRPADVDDEADDDDEDLPTTADEVLARLNRRRTA